VPAGHHQREALVALGSVDGEPGEVHQIDHVRVDELSREVEREHVEVRSSHVVLEREERDSSRAHRSLHVDPGGVGALGEGVGALVQDPVEDLEALVGQPDLVGVGVAEQPRDDPSAWTGAAAPCSMPM